MMLNKKQHAFRAVVNSRIQNSIVQIPVLSVALKSWQLASQAFAEDNKNYRKKQQWKSFLCALICPQFAYTWFEILESPDLLMVATHRKGLYLKPFRVYMSIRWTKKQKIKVVLDTYRFIMCKNEAFIQVLTHSGGIEMMRFNLNDTIEGILVLRYDYRYRKEGELVFSFKCDCLGGTIVDAAVSFEEMEAGRWACRIGCIQGQKQHVENSSKEVQKLMYGLRPKSFIVFIVQEFSRQLGFSAVYGAGDAIQAYRRKHAVHLSWRHSIHFDYNAIWIESGGRRGNDGWYELPLTPLRKSIDEIKSNKRSLYLKRYRMVDDLSLKIAEAVKKIV